MKTQDLCGETIEAGDEIAYAIANGSKKPTIATYRVLDVLTDGSMKAQQTRRGHRNQLNERPSILNFPRDRAVIVRKWSDA